MKAIICTKYGPPEVLQMSEVKTPVPRSNEVLIRIHATTAHIGDTKIRSFKPGLGPVKDLFFKPVMRVMLGFRRPRKNILGMDLAGEIVEIGNDVTRFSRGDRVFASAYEGFIFGAYAEYICLSQDGLIARKPDNMTYEEIAPVSNGALTALLTLRKANIQNGQRVLIYGASGSMGTYSIQLAKYFGAHVTGVCSTGNVALVESLGADEVLDYTMEGFSDGIEVFDVIFDSVAKLSSPLRKKLLKPGGTFLDAMTSTEGMKLKAEDLEYLGELCESGRLKTVIDRVYSFDEMIDAHRYVERGHKKGNVVVRVVQNDS